MRRILLVLAVAALTVVMVAASIVPAMANNGFAASGGASCNQGTENAQNNAVPGEHNFPGFQGTSTAENNIPTAFPGPETKC